MIITAKVMLLFFGYIALHGLLKFTFSSLNMFHGIVWLLSIIISALCAGIIWGGLFQ